MSLELAISPNDCFQEAVHSVWFSSATSALIAALEAVGARGQWVAVPPNVCPNVIAAIVGAECHPWFVDIELERQGMDPACLSGVISQVAAVIAVHAYGTPCKIDEIVQVAHQAGVPVIEDCAQADGATYQCMEVGSFGDIAVFSFGTGKIVDAGGGGLAVARDPRWVAVLESTIDKWAVNSDSTAGDDLGYTYRFLYKRFCPNRTELARESFLALVKTLAPLFKTKCAPKRIPELLAARMKRTSLVTARRGKYSVYVEQLSDVEEINPIPLMEGSAPWRFNAIVNVSKRDHIFGALLGSGINASTWYPRITQFLPESAVRSVRARRAN